MASLIPLFRRCIGMAGKPGPTRAERIAAEDRDEMRALTGRRFSLGSRPVIRWIKCDGLDDPVTKAAIARATRLFGSAVDYCLCTRGIDAARVRSILEWADQPVEWWPVDESDNPALAERLRAAGCEPERFGYWWKWFPERVRPDGPEWILDGDMVVNEKPAWVDDWAAGRDPVRITQDDQWPADGLYGSYLGKVDLNNRFYSGLISIPPGLRYMPAVCGVLDNQPLAAGHDGIRDMCEQGVIVAAFDRLKALPIPLFEFPFGRAFEEQLNFGVQGDRGVAWGYHFGHAFRMTNPHFVRLVSEGVIPFPDGHDVIERFLWLGGFDQWGTPGWSMTLDCARYIARCAADFAGRNVLELGTSRGRMAAVLATLGCKVTTVDHVDRGAAANLEGLGIRVVNDDAVNFLSTTDEEFDLIVCDLHGNSPKDWKRRRKPLLSRLRPGGLLLIDNLDLAEIPEWSGETGVRWFLKKLPADWQVEMFRDALPGVVKVTRP